MSSSKPVAVIRQVYDYVEAGLWAALLALVLYVLIWLLPSLPENMRRAESSRALKIAEENRSYCEKWGMKQDTHEHTLCTMDLQDLRDSIEQESAGAGGF